MEEPKINTLSWIRLLYNLLLPLVLLLGFVPWLIKMSKRGGYGSGLLERVGYYKETIDTEPTGVIYVHAVSVGEVMLALKLIREWQKISPNDKIVLAPTTATGHAVAVQHAPRSIRIIYSPIDLSFFLNRMFERFKPKQIILIESEIWPNLIFNAYLKKIPISLVNARLSQRSEKRYKRVKLFIQPILKLLNKVAVPEKSDMQRWENIGVRKEVIEYTGSIKFDQSGANAPRQRKEFKKMLNAFGAKRKIVMALSTHPGEEALIVKAMIGVDALCVVIPRHMERKLEVSSAIKKLGLDVVLRSEFKQPGENCCFVIDSTGEMSDWTAHADLVIIGKSFLAIGGQNPAEAIAAGVPVIVGPHMNNFEPLITTLRENQAIVQLDDISELQPAIISGLEKNFKNPNQTQLAKQVLERHHGAAARTVKLLAHMQ